MVIELKNSGYIVTIETNGKKYVNALSIADYVIVSIKTYSAGKPYTDMNVIDEILFNCDFVVFTCLVDDIKDFDFLSSNFSDKEVWCFLKFDDYDFNDFITNFITNDNWRLLFRIDRLLRCDFENTLKRLNNE